NPFTSQAKRVLNLDASKRVIGAAPLTPAIRFFQYSSTLLPKGVIAPRPVTTTRLSSIKENLVFGVCLSVRNGVANCSDLFSLLVGDCDAQFLFALHDQLNSVQRIRSQIVSKTCCRGHFLLTNAQLINDDRFYFVCNVRHYDSDLKICTKIKISPVIQNFNLPVLPDFRGDTGPELTNETSGKSGRYSGRFCIRMSLIFETARFLFLNPPVSGWNVK